MTTIAPGTIPQRIPRPLTKQERKALREKNGGHASAEQLRELEAAFSKSNERDLGEADRKRPQNNGWTA